MNSNFPKDFTKIIRTGKIEWMRRMTWQGYGWRGQRERGGSRGVVFRFPESRHKEKKLPGRRYFRAVKFDTPATRPSSDFLGRGSERMNGRYFCMYMYMD